MSKSSIALLAKAISSKRGLKQAEAERFVAKMFEVANQALDEDKLLKVKWLGTFKVAPVKDRESVDVNTGERIVIEGRDKISFTPDSILKEIINKPFAQFDTVVVKDGVDFSDIDEKFAQMRDDEDAAMKEPAAAPSEGIAVEEPAAAPSEGIAVEEPAAAPSEGIAVEEPAAAPSEGIAVEEPAAAPSEGIAVEEPAAAPSEGIAVEEPAAVPSEEVAVEEEVVPETSLTAVAEETGELVSPEEDSLLADETQPSVVETPSVEETQSSKVEEPMGESASEVEAEKPMATESESAGEDEIVSPTHHFVVPKYMVAVVLVLFVVLLGGMGWFAFNYGKMQAQRDHLAAQLVLAQKKRQLVRVAKKKTPAPVVSQEDSVQAALKLKAKEDSARLAASSEAVKLAEKYNGDPRVRTGAYRIVGVAQTVTVSGGQTLESLSKRYLGAGMECYVEALNGTSVVREGQKLKIPKLELKRKAK